MYYIKNRKYSSLLNYENSDSTSDLRSDSKFIDYSSFKKFFI